MFKRFSINSHWNAILLILYFSFSRCSQNSANYFLQLYPSWNEEYEVGLVLSGSAAKNVTFTLLLEIGSSVAYRGSGFFNLLILRFISSVLHVPERQDTSVGPAQQLETYPTAEWLGSRSCFLISFLDALKVVTLCSPHQHQWLIYRQHRWKVCHAISALFLQFFFANNP